MKRIPGFELISILGLSIPTFAFAGTRKDIVECFILLSFEHLMRTGEDPDDPGMLLQVMPWTIYGYMSENDLRAIYEFLSSIPSLPDNPNPGP